MDPKITMETMITLQGDYKFNSLLYIFFSDQYKKGRVMYVNLYQMYFMYPLTLEA